MVKFRYLFGMLAVVAFFALALAPPGFAAGGNADMNSTDSTDLAGANPYEGDITALATFASGMKSDFAAGDVEQKTAYIPIVAKTAGGDVTASGATATREYAI